MHESSDDELLARYAQEQSEQAFAILVARHVNLVYSVALRHGADSHQAKDIAQVVFLLLVKKAGGLSPKTVLPGWLYRTAQLTAANHLRMERRRQRREQEVYVQSLAHESEPNVWTKIAPVLDAALARLGNKERNAVILRFFEGKSLKEIGSALGASEDAAQKNLERALKKMRGFFTRRGVALSAATLASVLSAHSVQAAPAGLAQSIAAAGLAKGVALSGSAMVLMKSTLKIMTWLKIKTLAKIALWIALVAGTTTVAINAGTYVKQGRLYLFKGEYDQAIANFTQAIQLDPQSAPAHFGRGRANKLEGNYAQALQDYTQAIQDNPKAVAAYVNRGQIYNLEGAHDRAIEDFDRAIQLDAKRPIPYLDRGVAYVAKGDYAHAIADFRSALRINPQFSAAYNNLAWQFATCPDASLRNGRQAVDYATRACELSQWTNQNQISTLAASYAEAGDFKNAVKWEGKVLGNPLLSPKDAKTAQERLTLYEAHMAYHRKQIGSASSPPQ